MRRRAAFLLFAAVQFVVLTAIAMRIVVGYRFTANFFSELGATRLWWNGETNRAGAVLFVVALATVGVAFVAFAGTWRVHAFARGRARAAGIAAQIAGTLSGLAFIAVAATPVNLALSAHNAFVLAAFGFLLVYAACMAVAWWKNDATPLHVAASVAYVALVLSYVLIVVAIARHGVWSDDDRWIMVVAQKAIAYVSMVYVSYVTLAIRR